jgi:hypothetical protein
MCGMNVSTRYDYEHFQLSDPWNYVSVSFPNSGFNHFSGNHGKGHVALTNNTRKGMQSFNTPIACMFGNKKVLVPVPVYCS